MILNIMVKSSNAEDWIKFIDNVDLGENTNKDLIKSIVALNCASDVDVKKEKVELTKNYLLFS